MRFFAFLWAQFPVIIINGLAAMGDEDEEEQRAAVAGQVRDEVEEDGEILFVDDHKSWQSGMSKGVMEEEEEEGKAGFSGPSMLWQAGIVLGSGFFWYETFFAGMSALAILLDEPLCTAVFCLEVVTFGGSQTVVAAIR